MSAMAEIWMGELAKLKDKVLSRKPFISKGQERSEVEQTVKKEAAKKQNREIIHRDTSMLSESTVCLLMDRFVPW
ncbi:hypothetical protein G2W53_003193 [Senna tora]|uniref:Uncharacterized protein n=1 Tax=Senna tora TaxID=362788 RepID=A0A834X9V6_9FABA|nr:hypothetical protein G2W53_003193 [Senna tora]